MSDRVILECLGGDVLAKAWGGQFVGIGASRKMGWGRFDLRDFAAMQPN